MAPDPSSAIDAVRQPALLCFMGLVLENGLLMEH